MPFDVCAPVPPPSSPELDLLRLARNIISHPLSWTKARYVSQGGAYCALGAIGVAADNPRKGTRPTIIERRVARILADEIPCGLRFRFAGTARMRVVYFNDRKTTNHAMIIKLFDRAITRLEAKLVAKSDIAVS